MMNSHLYPNTTNKYNDNWIDSLSPEKDMLAPPFFAQRLIHRIQLQSESKLKHTNKLFIRAVAATIAVLLMINIYLIFVKAPNRFNDSQNISHNEKNWDTPDYDSYNNYSLLALD